MNAHVTLGQPELWSSWEDKRLLGIRVLDEDTLDALKKEFGGRQKHLIRQRWRYLQRQYRQKLLTRLARKCA